MPLRGALRKRLIKDNDLEARKQALRDKKAAMRAEERELEIESRMRTKQKNYDPQVAAISHIRSKGRGEWIIDILTGVFMVGFAINSGYTFGSAAKAPTFDAMQAFLMFAILLQLVKIGRKL